MVSLIPFGGGVSEVHPYGAGSHAPLANVREMPVCYPIKGNVDSMLYHRPDSQNYRATIAEVWFDGPSAAEAAGFTIAPRHSKDGVSAEYEPGGSRHPCEVAAVNANRTAAIGRAAHASGGFVIIDGHASGSLDADSVMVGAPTIADQTPGAAREDANVSEEDDSGVGADLPIESGVDLASGPDEQRGGLLSFLGKWSWRGGLPARVADPRQSHEQLRRRRSD